MIFYVISIYFYDDIQCFLDTTYLNTAFFLLLSAFLPTPVFFLLYLCKLILNRTYILQRIPCYNVHFRRHQSAFFLYFQLRCNVHQKKWVNSIKQSVVNTMIIIARLSNREYDQCQSRLNTDHVIISRLLYCILHHP